MTSLLTIRDLRRIIGQPAHVLNYALQLHGPEPVARIGIARCWAPEQLDEIRESLKRTAERSTRRPAEVSPV